MTQRITLQPAFILHAKPYRDSSLLLDILTQDYGRISGIARQARGAKNRKALVQSFAPLLISWSGKTELMSIGQIESAGVPCHLMGTALISGFYLNELLVRLLFRYDPHPNLYFAYQEALAKLQTSINPEIVLRLFECELITELGYGLQFNQEAISQTAILADRFYRFDQEQGFIASEQTNSPQILFRGKSLLALHTRELTDVEDLQAAKRLLRLVLAPLLGNKPIKSRELFVRG